MKQTKQERTIKGAVIGGVIGAVIGIPGIGALAGGYIGYNDEPKKKKDDWM